MGRSNPDAGGYDATDAVTYVWLGQALLMTVALWGGGATDDLAERIRTGDVAIDLYRPVGLLGWYLAGDLGRAAYHLLTRGLAPTVVGALLFDIRCPARRPRRSASLVSVLLAVRGQLRDPVPGRLHGVLAARRERSAHAHRRARASSSAAWSLPLVLFPGWLGDSRWRCRGRRTSRSPADIWLGQRTGSELVAGARRFQAVWARRAARRLPARAARARPARWWSRVAETSTVRRARAPRGYRDIAGMWIRAALAYPRVVLDDGGRRRR